MWIRGSHLVTPADPSYHDQRGSVFSTPPCCYYIPSHSKSTPTLPQFSPQHSLFPQHSPQHSLFLQHSPQHSHSMSATVKHIPTSADLPSATVKPGPQGYCSEEAP